MAISRTTVARSSVLLTFELGASAKKGEDAPAISIAVDAFNVTNRVNYGGFVGTITSPFFGGAVSALPPRRIQLSAEFHF